MVDMNASPQEGSGSKLEMKSPLPEFVVRLVSIDYYMTRPTPGLDDCYSQLEGKAIDQVPVIRIFGSTPSGQKTCMHVHGVSKLLRSLSKLYHDLKNWVTLFLAHEKWSYMYVYSGYTTSSTEGLWPLLMKDDHICKKTIDRRPVK